MGSVGLCTQQESAVPDFVLSAVRRRRSFPCDDDRRVASPLVLLPLPGGVRVLLASFVIVDELLASVGAFGLVCASLLGHVVEFWIPGRAVGGTSDAVHAPCKKPPYSSVPPKTHPTAASLLWAQFSSTLLVSERTECAILYRASSVGCWWYRVSLCVTCCQGLVLDCPLPLPGHLEVIPFAKHRRGKLEWGYHSITLRHLAGLTSMPL